MFNNYLIIPILLGICFREAFTLNDLNTAVSDVNAEAKRLAKSELIRKYMNESIDPCEDFYQFACGNWRTHHPASSTKLETHGLYLAVDDFNGVLIPFLTETDDKYTKSEWKVKNFYDSCLKSSSLKLSEYRQNMKQLIKEFGRMPALEGNKWQPEKFDWIKTIGDIYYKYNIGIIYGFDFGYAADPTAKELVVQSKVISKSGDDLAATKTEQKSIVEKNLKQFIGIKTKTAKQAAKEIVDFGIKLWDAYGKSGVKQETTFEGMHQKYSRYLDIKKLVKSSFGFIPDGVVIDDDPGYVETLATLIKKTPKHVVANYIFYTLMLEFESNIPLNEETHTNENCLEITKTHFLPILSKMAYRRSNLIEKEQGFRRIWQGLTTTLQSALESNLLGWFDDVSREATLEKLHLMKLYIASYDDVDFDELYKDLTLNSSDFMRNKKSITSFTAKQTRKSLNERRDDTFYDIGDFTPSYMFTANAVRFPLSSLVTDYMWSEYAPMAFNYGRLGVLTGHEIMHGFSGGGQNYNKIGIYIDWIYKDIEDSYDERRQCYYDQYHNFTLDNKQLPQEQSQGENLADNGGIYLAYHAYLRWLTDEARTQEELEKETLPDLNYTNKQLYFIGYSQAWCSDAYAEARFERLVDDEHSPDEFRAFVPLLNFGEFAKEFNCPIGSPMNPRKKCSIY